MQAFKNKYLSPYLFFLIDNGEIIVWDYKNHKQFILDKEHFERLLEISDSKNFYLNRENIDISLCRENLLLDHYRQGGEWGWDQLSQIFHMGTQNIPLGHSMDNAEDYVKEYIDHCEEIYKNLPELKIEKEGEIFDLPPADLNMFKKAPFLSVLKNRKTCRSFNGQSIDLNTLSTLMFASFGEIHGKWKELEEQGLIPLGVRKSSPSGGGLHASEAYLIVLNIRGLQPGIYHYRAHQHKLSAVFQGDCKEKLGYLLCGQHFAKNLSCGIFITSRFEKYWNKYAHSRAYRIALFDIGHLSQTFQLCATALNLHPWLTGAFLDDEVNTLLKIKDSTEHAMFFCWYRGWRWRSLGSNYYECN